MSIREKSLNSGECMLRKQFNMRPFVYQALQIEARKRQQDLGAVLEDMILTSMSPESREALEKWKRDMESRPPIEEDPKAMEGIKDLWVGYPALSTLEIAERIGYPYEAVSGAIKRMLQKGDLEPRGHLSSKPRKRV
jgi:hypothetical protein